MVHKLVEQKNEYLDRFMKLTEELGLKIEDQDFEKLENILDKRDKLIEEIDRIDSKLEDQKIDEEISVRMLEKIRAIRRQDTFNKVLLEKNKYFIGERLKKVREVKRANKLYSPDKNQSAFFNGLS